MSNIISNPDGTFTRRKQFPTVPAEPNPTSPTTRVLSKDVPVNPETRTTARLFLPREALHLPTSKLPLVFYYHGGGFLYLSAASSSIHDFCSDMALQLRAIVVSLEYRLAPEHRLPAAYDDAVDALHWIASTKEEWVTEFTDLSSCFLMGTSAGGNLAYHAGLRVCEDGDRLQPLRIKGLVLHHPFFGGSQRTGSELAMADDPILSLPANDGAWSLALPVGSDRDHEYCNPTVGKESGDRYVGIREMGWRVLVTGCFGDPLIDRQMQLAKTLEKEGVRITTHFGNGFHGMEISNHLNVWFDIFNAAMGKLKYNVAYDLIPFAKPDGITVQVLALTMIWCIKSFSGISMQWQQIQQLEQTGRSAKKLLKSSSHRRTGEPNG